jgi:riboflavin transporter FmnP
MKPTTKLVALIAVMSALGNVLGFLAIKLPSTPGTTVEFHLSVLPSLLLAVSVGPLSGAITGFLSLITATVQIGNVFIPFGNALFAAIAGLLAKKFRFPPPVAGVVAVVPYALYMWFACSVYNVPQPVIAFIIVKAFFEILISSTIVEFILLRPEVKNFLSTLEEQSTT